MTKKRTGKKLTTLNLGGAIALVYLFSLTLPMAHAQDADVGFGVQPAPEVRLSGTLEAAKEPRTSAFPELTLWFSDKSWLFRVSRVESVIPAYPAEQELQKVSGLGLRLLAENDVLTALQTAATQSQPIVLEGWLQVTKGVLQVKSLRTGPPPKGGS
jgi:hypothetical protein